MKTGGLARRLFPLLFIQRGDIENRGVTVFNIQSCHIAGYMAQTHMSQHADAMSGNADVDIALAPAVFLIVLFIAHDFART